MSSSTCRTVSSGLSVAEAAFGGLQGAGVLVSVKRQREGRGEEEGRLVRARCLPSQVAPGHGAAGRPKFGAEGSASEITAYGTNQQCDTLPVEVSRKATLEPVEPVSGILRVTGQPNGLLDRCNRVDFMHARLNPLREAGSIYGPGVYRLLHLTSLAAEPACRLKAPSCARLQPDDLMHVIMLTARSVPLTVLLAGLTCAGVRESGGVTRWFARLDLSGASYAQKRLVHRVSELLDQLEPARLDPAQQAVELDHGETWVTLRHDPEPWMEIRFVLSDGWVNFYGVMGHDEAYLVRPAPSDSWESDTIDILADLLQSTFRIDTYTLRGKPWREVLTISHPYNRISTEIQSLSSLLPLTRWAKQAGSRSATFECRGDRSSTK